MNNHEFINLAIEKVQEHINGRPARGSNGSVCISMYNVYVVWQVKVLQNYKALLATDIEGDQHYYEATYNGDKKQLYLDVYDKQENKCFEVDA